MAGNVQTGAPNVANFGTLTLTYDPSRIRVTYYTSHAEFVRDFGSSHSPEYEAALALVFSGKAKP